MSSHIFPATRAVLTQEPEIAPIDSIVELWDQQSPYNRRVLNTGIVHFGPGRFFRGHLARIIHQYLAQKRFQDQRWGRVHPSLASLRVRVDR